MSIILHSIRILTFNLVFSTSGCINTFWTFDIISVRHVPGQCLSHVYETHPRCGVNNQLFLSVLCFVRSDSLLNETGFEIGYNFVVIIVQCDGDSKVSQCTVTWHSDLAGVLICIQHDYKPLTTYGVFCLVLCNVLQHVE